MIFRSLPICFLYSSRVISKNARRTAVVSNLVAKFAFKEELDVHASQQYKQNIAKNTPRKS